MEEDAEDRNSCEATLSYHLQRNPKHRLHCLLNLDGTTTRSIIELTRSDTKNDDEIELLLLSLIQAAVRSEFILVPIKIPLESQDGA